jgi:hypothetical protein
VTRREKEPSEIWHVIHAAIARQHTLVVGWMSNREGGGIKCGRVIKPGPGTAHRPSVSDSKARVLYLLPKGKIEFTGP